MHKKNMKILMQIKLCNNRIQYCYILNKNYFHLIKFMKYQLIIPRLIKVVKQQLGNIKYLISQSKYTQSFFYIHIF